MTINEVLDEVDRIAKNNSIDRNQKIKWLDRLDRSIFNDLLQYKKDNIENFDGYNVDDDEDTELLAVAPYDELYVYYVLAQINLIQQEIDFYNNNYAMYEDKYRNYRNFINRTYRTKGRNFIKV
ncbi:hypothetical protein [uncultured Eubacterium sp.]|uniref:hypothetical protein n=1 Tax=uncultured Eubacterium sp. TaxID=165185 RepID=UPI002593351D|nr:hypothetical protein [uncultured Eubacterium sp.]